MKRILLKTTMALGLGIAASTAFAQSQQPVQPDAGSGQQTECQPGDTSAACQKGGATGGETGAAPAPKTEGQATDQMAPKTEGQAGDTTAPKTEGQAQAPKTDSETTGAIGDVNVTVEQKTEIRQVLTETKVEPVRDVDFDINVGVAVPRTIEVHPLPPRIVEIVPAYEGYMYFVLADGRIVIVEPDTLEIVVILA